MAGKLRVSWNWFRGWFDKNFTWKGLLIGLFVLYQIIPDTSGRNAYWLSMYPSIKDFVLTHAKGFLICLGFLLMWLDHRSVLAKQRRPLPEESSLKLRLEGIMFVYDSVLNITVFVLSAYLINKGEPTIAMDWKAEYEVNGSKEAMKSFYLISDYVLNVGDETITIENKHLMQSQVLTDRLNTGEAKAGRLIFTVPGNRLDQVNALQFKIGVKCSDYADRTTSAMFVPDPVPMVGIKMYPGERLSKGAKNPQAIVPTQRQLTSEVDKKE